MVPTAGFHDKKFASVMPLSLAMPSHVSVLLRLWSAVCSLEGPAGRRTLKRASSYCSQRPCLFAWVCRLGMWSSVWALCEW